jgi:manganese/zinc/iron transport system permease protein
MGDAISHSVLPGIALAFLVSGSRNLSAMLVGAFAAGLLSVAISALVERSRRAHTDAAIGMTYTSFFAVGVLLLSLGARNVDIDPSCVLYGLVEFAPLDTIRIGSIAGDYELPRSFVILSAVFLLNLMYVTLFYKELQISTFDPILARSLGFNTTAIHYSLLTVVTVTIVAAFEAVGSILVITMLIAPAATGQLLAHRIPTLIVTALTTATLAAVAGTIGATVLDTSVAGMMSVSAGALFFSALFFAPRGGIIARAVQRGGLQVQIAQEDILGLLYRWQETQGTSSSERKATKQLILDAFSHNYTIKIALVFARLRGHIACRDGSLYLTDSGLVEATALIRSHRLWESYLAKHLGLPADHLHDPSERAEHFIGPALTRELEKELRISQDPHGKKIP